MITPVAVIDLFTTVCFKNNLHYYTLEHKIAKYTRVSPYKAKTVNIGPVKIMTGRDFRGIYIYIYIMLTFIIFDCRDTVMQLLRHADPAFCFGNKRSRKHCFPSRHPWQLHGEA